MATMEDHEKALKASCIVCFLSIIPVAQLSVGTMYVNDCPRQPYIPIYLIVMGAICILLAFQFNRPSDDDDRPNYNTGLWYLVFFFIFCWFIAGNVCIYLIYPPNYNKNTTDVDPYCNKTLYLFAFWSNTLVYILLGGFLLVAICIFTCQHLPG